MLGGVDDSLLFPTSSIKQSLQHLQFCCFGLSLGVSFFLILQKVSYIKTNWLTVQSSGIKLEWAEDKKVSVLKIVENMFEYKSFKNFFSCILEDYSHRPIIIWKMNLPFYRQQVHGPLYMKTSLNSIVRNKDTSRNILLLMPSGPTVLSTCRDLRTSSISAGFKSKERSGMLVSEVWWVCLIVINGHLFEN